VPCQIIQSGDDEAVPRSLKDNGSITQLGQRLVAAIQTAASHGPPVPRASEATQHSSVVLDESLVPLPAAAPSTECSGVIVGAHNDDTTIKQTVVKQQQLQQLKNLPAAWPQLVVLEGASHACLGHEADLVATVCSFLKQLHPDLVD